MRTIIEMSLQYNLCTGCAQWCGRESCAATTVIVGTDISSSLALVGGLRYCATVVVAGTGYGRFHWLRGSMYKRKHLLS